jgi:hypothetical protein
MGQRIAVVVLAIVATTCGPIGEAPAPTSAAPSSSPIASRSASVSAETFPDLPLLAGASDGTLRRYDGGRWSVEASVCPAQAAGSNSITALRLSADGRWAFMQCSTPPSPSANADDRTAAVYDLKGRTVRVISGTSAIGIGPINADGTTLVAGQRGDCPMPAPVCQSKWALIDVVTGIARPLLPSGYWLGIEFRWTPLGLSYFLPTCAEAGCTDKAGTYLWDGTRWSKYADERLVEADARSHVVLERLRSFSQPNPRAVVERTAAGDRLLTTDPSAREFGIGLLDDGRVLTWKLDDPNREGKGRVLVYSQGQPVRESAGTFSSYGVVRSGDWIVSLEFSGPPSFTLHAYSVSRGVFVTRPAGLSMSGLVALP